ncbi:MAG: hypothetical protein V7733_10330 [Paraglaciecola polaris]|uniref:hypothetical protein n=1 Tax=Paraglaciecola polaris TaxID=222814 RepID=UPI00300266B4
MNDREILADAPESSVCIDNDVDFFDKYGVVWDIDSECFDYTANPSYPVRSLTDIQRIVDLESHLDAEANRSFILEGNNKDLAKELESVKESLNKVTEERLLAYMHISLSIPLEHHDKLIAALERNNLDQQAKGAINVIDGVFGHPESLTCDAGQWRRELMERAQQLRNQAKGLAK